MVAKNLVSDIKEGIWTDKEFEKRVLRRLFGPR
jgi:hypothetical protein